MGKLRVKSLLVSIFVLQSCLGASECCPVMSEISFPSFAGGFYAKGSWLYLKPRSSDGDLEYGSLITLTQDPANLTAILLQNDPGYQNSYQVDLGYKFPCSNQFLEASYFSFDANDKDQTGTTTFNQLIQDFLGGNYSISKASTRQKLHQADLTYGMNFVVDECFELFPYLGVRYADVTRDFDVQYSDTVLNPFPSSLMGEESSHYWGVGPRVGTKLMVPLFWNFGIKGHIGAAFLFGELKSKVDSLSERQITQTFNVKDSDHRLVTVLNSEIALVYSQPFCGNSFSFDLEIGYRADYYFKAINRINPFNGYVNNPNTFPAVQSSNLGLGGPYILLALNQDPYNCFCNLLSCCPMEGYGCFGLAFDFTSAWLQPVPTNDDLTFAILNSPSCSRGVEVDPSMDWTGRYDLRLHFNFTYDLQASYFHLGTSDKKIFVTKRNESFSSLNASGPSDVVFSKVESEVKYKIDQVDFTLGKYVQILCPLRFRGSLGFRYLDLKRTQDNGYLDGRPPVTTREKFPILKSRYDGIGPLFEIEPEFNFFNNFSLVGKFDIALLVGTIKASLDQNNFGDIGDSSNTVSTPKTPVIVPVIDTQLGLKYGCTFFGCLSFDVEGGYQFSEYFKGVNLLFPTLLTGLEQNNNHLKLLGPYFRVGISGSF